MKKFNTGRALKKLIIYLLLIVGSFLIILPFLWMLSTSLKDEANVFTFPPQWIPSSPKWENYTNVFAQMELWRGLLNTICIIIPPTIFGLFASALAAYSFAHLHYKGRDRLFFILLVTMMLPGVVMMIPSYVIFAKLDWLDTWLPLMVPGSFGTAACVFFLRQAFKGIPKEMIEAAKIDGMGHPRIFVSIIVPLGKAALITQATFGFLGGYNDFMGPLLYINSSKKMTLQLMLSSLQGMYSSSYSILMAGSVLAVIPTLAVYILCQRVFVEGITMSGLKG